VVTPQVNTAGGFAYTPSVRLTEGVHTVTAQVYDQAGNQAQSGPWSFTVVDDSAVSLGVTKYYMLGSQRIAMRQDDVVYFIHADHLGSTSLTTDITGTLVAETRYLPYGEERWITGTLVTDFTFTGQRAERGFGLMDYNARYYDPWLGRFISPDTLGRSYVDPQTLNRYSYVRNNPIIRADSTGHCDWCIELAIGALDLGHRLVTAPSRLVEGLSTGVQNIGNPEYAVHPNTVSTFVDAAISGFIPGQAMTPEEAAARIVPGEIEQTSRGVRNTVGWAIETTGAAVDTYAVVAPVSYGAAGALTKSSPSVFEEGFSAGEMKMIESVARQHGYDLTGVKFWRAEGSPPLMTGSWSEEGLTLYDSAFISDDILADAIEHELIHQSQGLTVYGEGSVAAAEAAAESVVEGNPFRDWFHAVKR
jgi:RHS repeat-associated protein